MLAMWMSGAWRSGSTYSAYDVNGVHIQIGDHVQISGRITQLIYYSPGVVYIGVLTDVPNNQQTALIINSISSQKI